MKYFHLVWSALMRRRTRTILTMASVLAAFLLFGLLDSVRTAFADAGKTVVGVDRLVTVSKLSFTVQLPLSLQARIAQVPGVSEVGYASWFGGVYQDPKNFFPNFAVSDNYFNVITEMKLPPDQLQAFRDTRTGAVVGADLARRFGWKVGQQIPLNATIWSASSTWTIRSSRTRKTSCCSIGSISTRRASSATAWSAGTTSKSPTPRRPTASRTRSMRSVPTPTTKPRPKPRTPSMRDSSASSPTSG